MCGESLVCIVAGIGVSILVVVDVAAILAVSNQDSPTRPNTTPREVPQ